MPPLQPPRKSLLSELYNAVAFIGLLWAVLVATWLFPQLRTYGLRPRSWSGLVGIVTMPLLHNGWGHLLANTPPLLVLLMLLAGSQARSRTIVAELIGLGGALLWLFGRAQQGDHAIIHIGASGLVFGLVAFLIASGLIERRAIPLLVSLVVGALYGFSSFQGLLPLQPGVSWDGHLWGAVAGVLVAMAMARRRPAPPAA